MGERDLEAELKEKDEIIMSLRLNEHLLKDKLEISRRNMSKQLERITALEKENEIKKEELLQKKLTNVLLAKIYVAQLSLNPHISNPYVEDSLKKEMQSLDKKIRELCGDVFNE